MVLEYGTLNSQTTGGSIESIRRTILENQGHHQGYGHPDYEKEVKAQYREMFYPASQLWRTKVIDESQKVWKVLLGNLPKLGN